MSARSPLICSAVELWYKKMLKIGSLSELTGIDTKIKVAGFQRLYSKWLWLLMAVYKPLFADAEDELSFNKTWDGFEKEGEIDLLIKNYKTVRNANVLPQILTVKFEEIVPKLNKCHNEIAKLHSSEIKIFDEVKDCFDEFLANYNKTKKAMLEKIAKTHPELQNDIDSIYDSENGTLATIVNGLGPLSDFMNSISDETLDTMLEDKNKTQQIFEDIMKKSGLETEINWLQQKESLELTPSDLDHDYLRKLLESGLIKLSYTKEY